MGDRHLSDNFWESEVAKSPPEPDENKHKGFPVANRIVNATEAEALERTGNHVFYNFADIPNIVRFMNRLILQKVSTQNEVMYEGQWFV